MNEQWYYFTTNQGLTATGRPPAGSRPIMQMTMELGTQDRFPFHRSFAAWGVAQRSPGIVIPKRIWLGQDGTVIFRFDEGTQPKLQSAVGAHAGLAAWLVLLDKFVETPTLLAEARQVWSVNDLAGALAFITPAFLPRPLLSLVPDNWERVARSLSALVANGAGQQADQATTVSY
jgi:hypothetical protein